MSTRFKNWIVHSVSLVVYRMSVGLLLWLKNYAVEDWKKAVNKTAPFRWYGVGKDEKIESEPFKRNDLEILSRKEITEDTLNKNGLVLMRPGWTREIRPFLENQLSTHTRKAYETDLKQFFQYLSRTVDLQTVSQLRPEHIISFRKVLEEGRLTGKPLAPASVNRKLAVVKSFFNWLKANAVVSDNPAQLVKGYPQSQESSLKGLSDEETSRILDKPSRNSRAGALHLAILHVLFYLGLRKGELIHLKMGDIDSERGVEVLKVRGKGHKIRVLPLVPKVKAALEHYFHVCQRDAGDKEAPLFIPTKNPRTGVLHRPLNPHAITYIVTRYARKVGILKRISPHSCRATCISNALDRKATHRAVQQMAGWSTPLMIQRYDKRRETLKNSAAFLVDYPEVAVG